jgi:hypothetical protein
MPTTQTYATPGVIVTGPLKGLPLSLREGIGNHKAGQPYVRVYNLTGDG